MKVTILVAFGMGGSAVDKPNIGTREGLFLPSVSPPPKRGAPGREGSDRSVGTPQFASAPHSTLTSCGSGTRVDVRETLSGLLIRLLWRPHPSAMLLSCSEATRANSCRRRQGGSGLWLEQSFSHHSHGDSGQENGLVTSRATSCHLNLPGTCELAQQVDHCCIGLVLLRWTRNADLHPVAVHAHDDGPASVGHDQ